MPLRRPTGEAPLGEDGAPALSDRHRRIAACLDTVRARMASALEAASRPPDGARLVAVTKSVGTDEAAALLRLGQLDLGENRPQELERKAERLAEEGLEPRWHFIGHLQRNKARRVLRLASEIHSVDSARLLDTLLALAAEEPARPGLYLQVKLADEAAKGGLAPAEVPELLERAAAGPLPVLGLMTMAPLPGPGAPDAREVFERLAALAGELPAEAFRDGRPELSMGMSSDLEEALAAGATVVRVGSDLFRDVEPVPDSPPAEDEA